MTESLWNFENPRFSDLIALYGFLLGTGVWENNGEILFDDGIPLNELISTREDLYEYLYNKLNGKCCENPAGQVFAIKEAAYKGRFARRGMPAEIEELLLGNDVPEWYLESMKKILYLFPKTHLVEVIKRDVSKYLEKPIDIGINKA